MAENVEIKARCASLARLRETALVSGAVAAGVLEQVDRYFEIDGHRRVKVRSFADGGAELIEYDRPEIDGVRLSHYRVTPVGDGFGPFVGREPLLVVRKRRELLLLDNVRVHLDQVDDLGSFLELEAVVDEEHDEARCRRQVDELLAAFGLGENDLIRASYSDLLAK